MKRMYELQDSTKKAVKYDLVERATRAFCRTSEEEIGSAKVWQGRNIVLFDTKGKYLTEYRWYPRCNRLRRMY